MQTDKFTKKGPLAGNQQPCRYLHIPHSQQAPKQTNNQNSLRLIYENQQATSPKQIDQQGLQINQYLDIDPQEASGTWKFLKQAASDSDARQATVARAARCIAGPTGHARPHLTGRPKVCRAYKSIVLTKAPLVTVQNSICTCGKNRPPGFYMWYSIV